MVVSLPFDDDNVYSGGAGFNTGNADLISAVVDFAPLLHVPVALITTLPDGMLNNTLFMPVKVCELNEPPLTAQSS